MSRRFALPIALAALAGCDDPVGPSSPRAAPVVVKAAPVSAPAPVKTREILGKRTGDVKDSAAELKTGGATAPAPRPIAKDPITLAGNTYITAIGRTAIDNIKHALDLHQADNDGRFPATHQEFMEKIIKANQISLPTLPSYQEYGYDAETHQLRILEYPDRKAAANAR